MVVIVNNIIRRKMNVEIPVESNYERVWEQMELLMSEDTFKRFLSNNIKNNYFNLALDYVLYKRDECKSKKGRPLKFISHDDIDDVSKISLLSIKQAKEYFKAAKNVSPMTKPVLLYYGMVNFAKTLINSTYHIENNNKIGHGLSVDKKKFEIIIYKEGEYQTFRDCFIGDPRLYTRKHPLKIDLKDLLSVVPSMRLSWMLAYNKKLDATYGELNQTITNKIFKCSSYIPAETCLKTSNEDFNIYYGMGDEGEVDLPEYVVNLGTHGINYNNATYFIEIPKFIHLIDVYYLAMFILCDYARYRPLQWSEFLNKDTNLFLIKNFLRRAELDFPMLIYSELTGMKTYFEKLG